MAEEVMDAVKRQLGAHGRSIEILTTKINTLSAKID